MKKFLVIGNPIEHSLSPKLHNFWFKQNKLEAIYEKKLVSKNELKLIIESVRKNEIEGVNVTVPFKESIIDYLDILSPEASETQSVNTIYKSGNNIIGHNTDIGGFELAIRYINYSLKDKRILIIGAGGVVPSIIYALNKSAVSKINLMNRTKEKAEKVKQKFNNVNIIEWGKGCEFDMIINATSLGLKETDIIKIDYDKIGENKFFYDVIYNPKETNFLKEAKKFFHKTENGKMMFIYQAHQAFTLWHKKMPEINDEVLNIVSND